MIFNNFRRNQRESGRNALILFNFCRNQSRSASNALISHRRRGLSLTMILIFKKLQYTHKDNPVAIHVCGDIVSHYYNILEGVMNQISASTGTYWRVFDYWRSSRKKFRMGKNNRFREDALKYWDIKCEDAWTRFEEVDTADTCRDLLPDKWEKKQ